jgi:hypothetical protein
MNSMLALATQLRDLNERLERGTCLDQLVVVIEAGTDHARIEHAIASACAARGVSYDNVGQVVIVERLIAVTDDDEQGDNDADQV